MPKLYKNNSVSMDSALNIIPIRRFAPKIVEPVLPAPVAEEEHPAVPAASVAAPVAPPEPLPEIVARQAMLTEELALLEQKVQESERQAARIIESAMEEARLIEKTAYETMGARVEKAVKQGYADGYKLGHEDGQCAYDEAIAKIGQFFTFLSAQEDEMLARFEDELYALVFDITKKIIHKEIANDDHAFFQIFDDAIANVRSSEWLTLTVADEEYEIATRNKSLLFARLSNVADFKIVKAAGEEKGVCLVETSRSIYDASIETQLEKIREIVEQARGKDDPSLPEGAVSPG